jgi:hypothetical protein
MADAVVKPECLAAGPGSPRFLEGRTSVGAVALAPNAEQFSGTAWRRSMHGDIWTLQCLDDLTHPRARFLKGRVQDGVVGLANVTGDHFPGTQWQASGLGNGRFRLQCLDPAGEPNFLFLQGHPQDGTVGLAPSAGPVTSGTIWFMAGQPIDPGTVLLPVDR